MDQANALLPKTLAAIEQGRQAGLHLGVQLYVSVQGEVIADLAAGENEPGVPLEPGHLMLWLSSGKPVTAMAVAQLWERHQLGLDDPVARYIPEFGAAGKHAITIRHLLTHTGGFRSADSIPETLDWDQTLALICRSPLEPNWIPGQKAGYHTGSSWFVLGEIVRRLTGRALDRYVREQLFEPLGINDAWIGMPPEAVSHYGSRIARTYVLERGSLKPHPLWNTETALAACRPGGSARGPMRALGRFYEALLTAWTPRDQPWRSRLPAVDPILQPDTIRLFTARHRSGLFDETFKQVMDWGLGFLVNSSRYGYESVPYGYGPNASANTFGHSGSQSSCAFCDPARGWVVAWACNGMPGEPRHQRRVRSLHAAIYEDLDNRP